MGVAPGRLIGETATERKRSSACGGAVTRSAEIIRDTRLGSCNVQDRSVQIPDRKLADQSDLLKGTHCIQGPDAPIGGLQMPLLWK